MSVDADLVAGLRTEVLSPRCPSEHARQTEGRPALARADEQALGGQLIAEALERRARQAITANRPVMAAQAEDELARAIFDALFRLNRLQQLLDDPAIENINANGFDQVWVRYADGRREQAAPIASSDAELEEMLRTTAARTGIGERRFDRGSPRLSLQLPDGSRLFALMAVSARPACRSASTDTRVTPDDLMAMGTLWTPRPYASLFSSPCWPKRAASSAASGGRQDHVAPRHGGRHLARREVGHDRGIAGNWDLTDFPSSTPTWWPSKPANPTSKEKVASAWLSSSAGRCG